MKKRQQKKLKKLSEQKINELLSPLREIGGNFSTSKGNKTPIEQILEKNPFHYVRALKPPSDFNEYIGKSVRTMEGETVVIEKMVGSMFYPTRFEINGAHHVVILDFYAQMNGDDSITPEEIQAFDEMTSVVEKIQKNPKSKDSHETKNTSN